MDTKLNIYQRMAAVMDEVGYVQKTGRTKGGPIYNFVRHDDVVNKLRPSLIKHGIVPVSTILPDSVVQDGNRTQIITEVRLVNVDNPSDYVTAHGLGFGIDNQDKGPGKAASYGKKYALMQLFLLETGDDPESDNINHGPRPKPKPQNTEQEQPTVTKPQKASPPADEPAADNQDEPPDPATILAERKRQLSMICEQMQAPKACVVDYLEQQCGERKFDALDEDTQLAVLQDWAAKAEIVRNCKASDIAYISVFQAAMEASDSHMKNIHCATAGKWRMWLEEATEGATTNG